jgi:hypothetical protein
LFVLPINKIQTVLVVPAFWFSLFIQRFLFINSSLFCDVLHVPSTPTLTSKDRAIRRVFIMLGHLHFTTHRLYRPWVVCVLFGARFIYSYWTMTIKDYKLNLRDLRDSHTLVWSWTCNIPVWL